MSMITEQIKSLREAANIWYEFKVSDLLNKAADTIEQLAAKVRAENNVSQPCEDAISRKAVLDTTICEGISCNECSFNEIDGEPGCLLHARIDELPSVTQKSETVTEFADRCRECGAKYGKLLKQEPSEDVISRQAVIDAINANCIWENEYNLTSSRIKKAVESLPPVNPQYTEDEIQKMQDLEQAEIEKAYELGRAEGQKSEDAISRQAVLDLIEHYNSDGLGSVFYGYEEGVKFADAVNKLPPVNPQPKIGHWIKMPIGFKCSNCNELEDKTTKYCPNCGVKMVGP